MNEEITKSIEVLKRGGTFLYPTDTIWGIGCDATNADAVSKVYQIKKRVDSKAMLVLVDSIDMIYDYVREVPEMALQILEELEYSGDTKPLTIIYPEGMNLAPNLLAEDGSIGIRISSDPFSQQLIRKYRHPIVSSSANIAGSPSPANFKEISDEIRNSVDYTVDWRQDDRMRTGAACRCNRQTRCACERFITGQGNQQGARTDW